MKKVFFYASVIPICFLTWLATSSLLAQQSKKAAAPPAVHATETVGRKTVTERTGLPTGTEAIGQPTGTEAIGPMQGRLDPGSETPVSMGQLEGFDVAVVGGKALVNAKVFLADSRKKDVYIWRLRLLDGGGQFVAETLYDNQVFAMKPEGSMEPTFRESFDLPPGKSIVQLSLYKFTAGIDLSTFKDEEQAKGYLIVRATEKVEN